MKQLFKKVRLKLKTPTGRGAVLLAVGALLGKGLGLVRDRLLNRAFPEPEVLDAILASFRLPDFFFFLLISGTISTLLLPRVAGQTSEKTDQFISSFIIGTVVLFGGVCTLGVIFTPQLLAFMVPGFSSQQISIMLPLVRTLFAATWLISISSVFIAYLQHKKTFLPLAITPLLYTTGIITALLWLAPTHGPIAVGYGALLGAGLHVALSTSQGLWNGLRLNLVWKKPQELWQNFWIDFSRRVGASSVVQIIHMADLFIASFLLKGTVSAFLFGSALGQLLLTIVGLSTANAAFPLLTERKHNPVAQNRIIEQTRRTIFMLCIPFAIVASIAAKLIVQLVYGLSGDMLIWATWVFQLTVLSLPLACIIPLYSRAFLANDDTHTPLHISLFGAAVSLGITAFLTLVVFPRDIAIIGLGIGNILTNTLLGGGLWWKWNQHVRRSTRP